MDTTRSVSFVRRGWRAGLIGSAAALLLAIVPVAGTASAQTATNANGWQPGPGALGDNAIYDGYVDLPVKDSTQGGAQILFAGWFVDKSAQGWSGADDVQVYKGLINSGGTLLARGSVGTQSRPDVALALNNPFYAASGFNALVNASLLGTGAQTVAVYLHTPSKGWWYKQVTFTISTTAPAPAPAAPSTSGTTSGSGAVTITSPYAQQKMPTSSSFTLQGSAPNADRVQIYFFGERGQGYSSYVGDATLSTNGDWSLEIQPTKFSSIHGVMYAYARDKTTQKESLATQEFNICDNCS